MDEVVSTVVSLASQAWESLVTGFLVILALMLLAYAIRTTAAYGVGSGKAIGETAVGFIGIVAAALFLFLGVPPMLREMLEITACSHVVADITLWSQRALVILLAFRMLKAAYMAVFAQAMGSGEAVAIMLQEAAGVIGVMLILPFISGVAVGLLGC